MEDVVAERYELGAELGRGGMARVFAARDQRLHRSVAVKVMAPAGGLASDPTARARFVREARLAASFTHPHAVSVYDVGDVDGLLYLVMELVDGPSVATLLATSGALPVDTSVRLVDEVLQALGAAHRAGIVHRDVKPGNVLVAPDGRAKLADFGIATRLDAQPGDLTLAGQIIGTPGYLAPEQVTGSAASVASDLYSAGVLLFEMLTGTPPYPATSPIATALAHRDAPVPDVRARRPEVPTAVADAVRLAMAKDPGARFRSADDMRAALRGDGRIDVATSVGPAPLLPSARRPPPATAVLPSAPASAPSRWWLGWSAVALALAVAVLVVVLGTRDGSSAQPDVEPGPDGRRRDDRDAPDCGHHDAALPGSSHPGSSHRARDDEAEPADDARDDKPTDRRVDAAATGGGGHDRRRAGPARRRSGTLRRPRRGAAP